MLFKEKRSVKWREKRPHNKSDRPVAGFDSCRLKPIWSLNAYMSKPSYTADKLRRRAGQACTLAATGLDPANSYIRGNTCCHLNNAEFPALGEFAIVPRTLLPSEPRIGAILIPSMRLALSAFSVQACYALKRVANVNCKLIKARKDPPIRSRSAG